MANSISVAVDERETIASGIFSMVTEPLSASTVTGNADSLVVEVVGTVLDVVREASVVVVGSTAAVVAVSPPVPVVAQAATISSIARSKELPLI
jgi:hypothetical protein